MRLTGILDNSLNGQLCVRGFANIKDLARISEADYTYQRELLGRTDIKNFLETQTYLFFPEVILSYKIKFAIKDKKGKQDDEKEKEPLKLIQEGSSYKCNLSNDNTEIKVKTVDFGKAISSKMKIVELNLDDSLGKCLHRIDGNHRLNAAEKSEHYKVNQMVIPFCILLGTEFYDKSEHRQSITQEEKNFDKAIKVFFHNINTKTIPLTSEENLKVMIDDRENFPDEELSEIFGGEYPVLTRELVTKVNPDFFTGISHILKANYRTFYNSIFKRMLSNDYPKDKCVKIVSDSLKAIDVLYSENSDLKANESLGLLTVLLWYHMKGKEKFNGFKNWILNNHIFEVSNDVSADSLISLYDKISSQEIKVFVAMPFFDGNPDIVADYNKIYDDKIKEIAAKYNVNMSLFPIMCEKGNTQDQIQDIINKIKVAKIVFADITDNNANVSYEMGWARALGDKCVIMVRRQDTQKPKTDYQNDTYHDYDDNARSISLGKVIEDNILEVLEKNFGLIKREK